MKGNVLDALPNAVACAAGGGTVECHETHGSWVFVAGDRALKVKKPVVLPFLDYGTLERRRAMCREEVRLNRRLAPELYRGTVSIVAHEDALAIEDDDEAPGAVEVAVDMRRYNEGDTLAERVRTGTATPGQLRAVGERLARFHATEPRPREAQRAFAALRAAVRTTLDDLQDDEAAREIDAGRVGELRGVMEAALAARRDELLERGRRGLVVDGHGDLRAEHVILTDPVQVVDGLEFDPALRVADVSCDLGFLVMDLEGAGADDLAAALVDGYREAGGDPGDRALLATMACYRALVRAKVDLVGAGRGSKRAGARLEQAVRLGWRARGQQLIAVCGPPASGKSTLARELCAQSGMAHVASDVVRKARAGLAPTERAPAAASGLDATLATYRELGEHAAAAYFAGRGAVVDATLGEPAARDALRGGLGPAAAHLRYVECRVPADEAAARARARELDAGSVSDATPEVAARLAAAWAALDEVPADRHLMVRTDRSTRDVVSDVTALLDRTWA
jgi:aminoglycoside phosphotransferase family enzyme/predicted kinase